MTTTANHRPPVTFADSPPLMSLMTGDAKHDQAATSTLDVLWVLYDRVLRVTPQTAGDDARDRFVMSKDTGRWPTTRCSRPRASWSPRTCPASARSTPSSGRIRTGSW